MSPAMAPVLPDLEQPWTVARAQLVALVSGLAAQARVAARGDRACANTRWAVQPPSQVTRMARHRRQLHPLAWKQARSRVRDRILARAQAARQAAAPAVPVPCRHWPGGARGRAASAPAAVS